ncbi:MAG: DUF885 domain-containing protein [Myxococcota bacterium]
MQRTLAVLGLLFVMGTCEPISAIASEHDGPPPASPEYSAGVKDQHLADLLQRHWAQQLFTYPQFATRLGEHRFDGELEDNSPQGIEAQRASTRAFLAEAQQIGPLTGEDETTRALFIMMLENEVAREVCRFEDWTLSPRDNPVTSFNYLATLHRVKDFEDAERLVRRFEKAPGFIDNVTARLKTGIKAGLFANAESTRRVLKMVDDLLAAPLEQWPMYKPATVRHKDWTPAQQAGFRKGLRDALQKGVKPALERYRALINKRILPKARSDQEPGLSALPLADACYRARIRAFTTLSQKADEIHRIGLSEIRRINDDMKQLGAKLFVTRSLPQILKRLRTDPSLKFSSAAQIEATAEAALRKAKSRMSDAFNILPKAECIVSRIPDYEAPFTTIAYYRQPDPTGARPGQFFINVYAPKTRPKYEMEALAFHEAIPGHHLQIAIAQERAALPSFRRHMGMTAFVEGWALYTEQLADEMGMYSGDLDRMGMLSYEAWRAARLVVDTGLHAMGWSRTQAQRFMLEHTALAPNNIDNEVDRYISWPGQALAYKTGQMEIWRLRRAAQKALGQKFDLKGFHDAVLSQGAVSLPILNQQVQNWVKSQSSN